MNRLAVAVALLGAVVLPAIGQSPPDPIPPEVVAPDGTEYFRGLFDFVGIRPLDHPDGLFLEPQHDPEFGNPLENRTAERSILVLMGDPTAQSESIRDPAGLAKEVLMHGGAVLIAVDGNARQGRPLDLGDFFPRRTGLTATGERVYCPNDADCFGAFARCPFARPRSPSLFEFPAPVEWRLFENLTRVATYRPTALVLSDPSPYARAEIARFPRGSRVGGGDGQPIDRDRRLAVAGAGTTSDRPFRSLVVADPHLFSNFMLTAANPQDPKAFGTDNLEFAMRTVEWLREPVERKRCLFVENGVVKPRFDEIRYSAPRPGIPPIPIPSPTDPRIQAMITDGINSAIAKAEDANVFNRAITGRPDSPRYNSVLVWLGIAAVTALLGWLLRRAWKARHSPDRVVAPKLPTVAKPGKTLPGPFAVRERELAAATDLSGPVGEYLREMFRARGLPADAVGGKMPRVEVNAGRAPELLADLRTLWGVAFPSGPAPLNFARWKELEPMIDAVRRAADRGRWRFAPGGAE